MPMPDPATATDARVLRAGDPARRPLGDGLAPWSGFKRRRRRRADGRPMTYLQAISDGLRDELRADERVLVMGEDIGVFGGAFKVTDGFIEEFGADRVMDTPLAESAIIGTAVGAAVVGMRPVCEMQFSDFISCGFDQLVNVAGQDVLPPGPGGDRSPCDCPPAAASPAGRSTRRTRRRGSCTRPGLKVVAPSTAEDAKGLLITRDPRPEPGLLHGAQAPLPPHQGRGAGRCRTRRRSRRGSRGRGHRSVVIAYGAMVHTALEATEDLDGASVEVLDLRSLVPLDEQAILDSVAQLLEGGDRRRGEPDLRGRRPSRGADRRARVRGPRRPGRPGRHARRADPVLARRSSRRCCPASIASRRRAVSSSRTEPRWRRRRHDAPDGGVGRRGHDRRVAQVEVGDRIAADETICEISTDKIDTEVAGAGRRGRRRDPRRRSSATVEVGTVLARIASRRWRRVRERAAPERGARRAAGGAEAPDSAATATAPPSMVQRTARQRTRAHRRRGSRRYSPVVQRIAAEHGIDLVAGGGHRPRRPGAQAGRARLRRAAGGDGRRRAAAAHREPVPARAGASRGGRTRRRRVSCRGCARQIGEHMKRSLDTAATLHDLDRGRHEPGRGGARAARRDRAAARGARVRSTALREHPALNAWLEGERYTLHDEVHLGIAVSLGEDEADRAGRRTARTSSRSRASPPGSRTSPGAPARSELRPRRGPRRHVHDHQPRPVRVDHGDADDQPAAGRDPRPRGGRQAPGRRDRRRRQRLDRDPAR